MAQKKIILLKSQFNKVGGLEKYAWKIAQAFAQKNYHVDILTTGIKAHFPSDPNIEFHYFDIGYGPNFMRIDQFDRYCNYWQKKYPSPVVLGMDRNTEQTHIRAGNGVHHVYLKNRHSYESSLKKLSFSLNPLHRKILEIEKKSFESTKLKKIITNSYMVRNEILSHYNTPEEKVHVLHNGVEWHDMETDFLHWQEEREKFQQSLNLDPACFHFLFIGSGFKRKGLKPLLYSLAELKNQDFYLSVIGNDNHIKDYIRLAKRLHLSKKVFFFGMRKDTRKFLQLSDCLVLPTFYDPFANVTLEALAMGLFVITSSHNGAKEILHEKNGVVIENLLDRDLLSSILEQAMYLPKTQESANNIRNSVQSYDFSNQLTHFVDIIENS